MQAAYPRHPEVLACKASLEGRWPGILGPHPSRLASLAPQDDGVRAQVTVIDSSPVMVEPSSSVQVSTTGPDCSALNLNWIYGFAEIAVSKSAANTCFPATVQTNLLRILRGTMAPAASRRFPVSITCDTRAFTSTSSPFLASFLSSLMRGLTVAIVFLLLQPPQPPMVTLTCFVAM